MISADGSAAALPGLEGIFESHPLPMWVYDAETLAFLAVNPAAVEHYGWSVEEFGAMTLRDIRSPEDVPDLAQRVRDLEGGSAASRGWRHRTRTGRVIEVDIYSRPVHFQGRPGRLVLAIDVTERRLLEAGLAQAQRLEAVGRLAGGIAHDFNNLLTAMGSGLDLLESELDGGVLRPSELRRDLGAVRGAVERAGALTRKLLALARRQVLHLGVQDANEAVQGVSPLLRTLVGGTIRLELRLAPGLPPLRSDPSQLEQVLLNLAVNAKDAMPRGGVLTVETAVRPVGEREAARIGTPAGTYVEIAVGDTGTGMSPEVMAHLFEPFYTTKPVGKGTGLGLSTVNGIMRQHGGAVAVKSVEGEGSRFALLFPALSPVGPPQDAPLLLLVDDDYAVRTPVARLLRRHGFGVLEAGSGVEALELWARRGAGVSAVVTDIVMPGMTGPVLLRELRRQRPNLPALLVTGFSADAVRDHGDLELDAVLLEKPFDSATLLQRVRALIPPVAAR